MRVATLEAVASERAAAVLVGEAVQVASAVVFGKEIV